MDVGLGDLFWCDRSKRGERVGLEDVAVLVDGAGCKRLALFMSSPPNARST
jgi:hypothetical protein